MATASGSIPTESTILMFIMILGTLIRTNIWLRLCSAARTTPTHSVAELTAQCPRKVIGLDDLLSDHYKQKSSVLEKSKRTKAKKSYSSDEDEDIGEANLSRCVEECQKEMGKIYDDDEVTFWGFQIFGDQILNPECTHAQRLKSIVSFTSLTEAEKNGASSIGIKPYSWNDFLHMSGS